MRVRFLTPARQDLIEATSYFEEQMPGLGARFQVEAQDTIARIRAFPLAWPPLSPRTRRCLLNRFPFSVIYEPRQDEIIIVAIGHQHREPDFWKTRIR